MKHGVGKGYNSGCCDGLEIWGVSCNSPGWESYRSDSTWQTVYPYLECSYDMVHPVADYNDGHYSHEIVPDLFGRNPGDTWNMNAAKVPGTYPNVTADCGDRPISSSGLGNGTWEVDLGIITKHVQDVSNDDETSHRTAITHCMGSRAIYTNGQQSHLIYRTETKSVISGFSDPAYGGNLGDFHLITIAYGALPHGPTDPSRYYAVGTLDGLMDASESADSSSMEKEFTRYHTLLQSGSISGNVLNHASGFNSTVVQKACNTASYGKEYFIVSSYYPGATKWSVGRLKYEGTRWTTSGGATESGLEVFCTRTIAESPPYEQRVGDSATVGNYWIVMPTCRVYIDSTILVGTGSTDECWVCAIHKSGSNPKIITSQWLSKRFESGGGEWTGYADGTLSNTEVTNANTILDTSKTELTSRYPTESWANIQIRAYNRVYDPTLWNTETETFGHSRDLLLFTTHDEVTYQEADTVVATFEGGDLNKATGTLPDSSSISSLEDIGMTFEVGGLEDTSGWVSTASVSYGSDTPINGSYSAHTNPVILTTVQPLSLSITINKTVAGYVTFNYRHHNRIWGMPGSGIGTQLFNFGVPENYLDILLNGTRVNGAVSINGNPQFQVDNGSGYVSVIGKIDNITSPEDCTGDDTKFTAARSARIYVPAGTHTIRFVHQRGSDENDGTFSHLYSQIDNLELGDLMLGEDTTAKRRWLFNGQRVQKAEWWAWPKVDEESETDLTGRVSTAPDYITLDKVGRILYGNPHYVVRLIRSEDDSTLFTIDNDFGGKRGTGWSSRDGGYVRFTATTADIKAYIGEGLPDCDTPDSEYTETDIVLDPPWGAFQILPIGSAGDFQVRGVNGSLRDATEQPFSQDGWPYETPSGTTEYERFAERLYCRSGSNREVWTQRAYSWSISNDGKIYRPHVEVLWRTTKFAPAFPAYSYSGTTPIWPRNGPDANGHYGPFQSNFATKTSGDVITGFTPFWECFRIRDSLRLPEGSSKPRWSRTSYIVPATFTDTLSQNPQGVWVRQIGNDPDETASPWDSDDEGPWPSGSYQLVQARYVPTGYVPVLYHGTASQRTIGGPSGIETCDDPLDPDNPVSSVVFGVEMPRLQEWRVYTDFDAVDEQVVCCDAGGKITVLNLTPPSPIVTPDEWIEYFMRLDYGDRNDFFLS